jgi:hypothetical protein
MVKSPPFLVGEALLWINEAARGKCCSLKWGMLAHEAKPGHRKKQTDEKRWYLAPTRQPLWHFMLLLPHICSGQFDEQADTGLSCRFTSLHLCLAGADHGVSTSINFTD